MLYRMLLGNFFQKKIIAASPLICCSLSQVWFRLFQWGRWYPDYRWCKEVTFTSLHDFLLFLVVGVIRAGWFILLILILLQQQISFKGKKLKLGPAIMKERNSRESICFAFYLVLCKMSWKCLDQIHILNGVIADICIACNCLFVISRIGSGYKNWEHIFFN